LTAADVTAINLHNSATAVSTPPSTPNNPNPPPLTTPPTPVDTPFTRDPITARTMTVTSTGPYSAGDTIEYQFVVENTGDVTLTDVSVTDELPGLSALVYAWPGAEGVLEVGQSVTATATYVVTAADVNAGNVHNSATADGTPPSTPSNPNPPPVVSPPDEVVVEVETGTDLSIEKRVSNATPIIGE